MYFLHSFLGPLPEVSHVQLNSNTSSITISWTAPFSLDIIGVDPDIWYSVLIYNVTDENNPTAILCTDCSNITETHYTFTPDYLSPCHVYNFSVIPVNGAGQGESSPNVTGYISYYGVILIVYTFTQIDTVGYYVVPELKICRKMQ